MSRHLAIAQKAGDWHLEDEAMILATRTERKMLLKAGFTGKQIEALYFVWNRFEYVTVAWDEAATKPAGERNPQIFFPKDHILIAGVQAAPSLVEVRT